MIQLQQLAKSGMRVLVLVAFLSIVISCNDGENKEEQSKEALASTSLTLNCVVLQKAQIQNWVDKGWTDPAKPDSLIKKILLQFYTPDGTDGAKNMQLAVYPAKNYLLAYSAGRQNAAIDSTCVALPLSGKAILSNNYLSLAKLGILDTAGKLKDFSFIRLRPVQDPATYGDYVTFAWEVVKVDETNKENILFSGKTSDPCPTFCEDTEGFGS